MSPRRVFRPSPPAELRAGFARIRARMGVPEVFPPEADQEAERAAHADAVTGEELEDARDVEFLTIDPPGSTDLDQAFHGRRRDGGFTVDYAITDVARFVAPGGRVDAESRRRGQTLYSPDVRTTLYPVALERAASLLPGAERAAILWTFDLDDEGVLIDSRVRRARVRSRRRLSYAQAQEAIDEGTAGQSLNVLREVGGLLEERERARGGVSLDVPAQEVVREDGGYRLAFLCPQPVEGWNAQISLLTGMTAAARMLDAGVGLLRTLPPVSSDLLGELARTARALDVVWPEGMAYPGFLRSLDPQRPEHAALMTFATRIFTGAGYTPVRGRSGEGSATLTHHAIAAPYAHVTAPLRRLADRFANEIVLSTGAGRSPPAWAVESLPELPAIMAEADRRADELERRSVDYVEAVVLARRVGETFEGLVIEAFHHGGTIQLRDPAVRGRSKGAGLPLGERIQVRLVEADPARGSVLFVPS